MYLCLGMRLNIAAVALQHDKGKKQNKQKIYIHSVFLNKRCCQMLRVKQRNHAQPMF